MVEGEGCFSSSIRFCISYSYVYGKFFDIFLVSVTEISQVRECSYIEMRTLELISFCLKTRCF